jgi:hypothetical protein
VLSTPAAPTGTDLITDSDSFSTGASGSPSSGVSSDNITNLPRGFTLSGNFSGNIVAVEIYDDTDRVNPIGQAALESASVWSYTHTGAPYANGTRGFMVRAVDAAGNKSDF